MIVEQDPLDSDGHKFEPANLARAKMVGGQYGLISSCFGLCLAYIIGIFLFGGYKNSILWFFDLDLKELVPAVTGGVALLLAGYFLGRFLAILIKDSPGYARLFGTLVGLMTIATGVLAGTMALILEMAIWGGSSVFAVIADAFVFLPGFLIFITGALPAILMGIWLGKKVEAALETENG